MARHACRAWGAARRECREAVEERAAVVWRVSRSAAEAMSVWYGYVLMV